MHSSDVLRGDKTIYIKSWKEEMQIGKRGYFDAIFARLFRVPYAGKNYDSSSQFSQTVLTCLRKKSNRKRNKLKIK